MEIRRPIFSRVSAVVPYGENYMTIGRCLQTHIRSLTAVESGHGSAHFVATDVVANNLSIRNQLGVRGGIGSWLGLWRCWHSVLKGSRRGVLSCLVAVHNGSTILHITVLLTVTILRALRLCPIPLCWCLPIVPHVAPPPRPIQILPIPK